MCSFNHISTLTCLQEEEKNKIKKYFSNKIQKQRNKTINHHHSHNINEIPKHSENTNFIAYRVVCCKREAEEQWVTCCWCATSKQPEKKACVDRCIFVVQNLSTRNTTERIYFRYVCVMREKVERWCDYGRECQEELVEQHIVNAGDVRRNDQTHLHTFTPSQSNVNTLVPSIIIGVHACVHRTTPSQHTLTKTNKCEKNQYSLTNLCGVTPEYFGAVFN